jgi:hypothetical protein
MNHCVTIALAAAGSLLLGACGNSQGTTTDPTSPGEQPEACLESIAAKQVECQVPAEPARAFREQWCNAPAASEQVACFQAATCSELMEVILAGGLPCIPTPTEIALPLGFQPEGITRGPGPLAFVGTMTRGGVVQVDLRSGAASFLVEPPPAGERTFAGLAYDEASQHLFACGAWNSNAFVFDARTGDLLQEVPFPEGSMLNSVALRDGSAYFTDSYNAVFYRLPLSDQALPVGEPEAVPLAGDFEQVEAVEDVNSNGIVALPESPYLLIVNSADGALYRVDPESGNARAITIDQGPIVYADGLFYDGGVLYVVQNGPDGHVFTLSLSHDLTQATVTAKLDDPRFIAPSTAVHFGNSLWVVNSRLTEIFHGAAGPSEEFSLLRVDLATE